MLFWIAVLVVGVWLTWVFWQMPLKWWPEKSLIGDIKYVDVICVLDIDHTNTAPEVVLAWMHSVLARYYTEGKRQGRSIGVNAARTSG